MKSITEVGQRGEPVEGSRITARNHPSIIEVPRGGAVCKEDGFIAQSSFFIYLKFHS
jgi:hypothetical protein